MIAARAGWRTPVTAEALAVLIALGLNFGLRYYYFFHYASPSATIAAIGGDAEEYLKISYAFSLTGTYGSPVGVDVKGALQRHTPPPLRPDQVQRDAWRPPLWPAILAALLKVAQYDLNVVFLLRFMLDGVTLLLFWRLLAFLKVHRVGRWAALLLLAIHPAWLIYSTTLLTEPLTLLLQIALAASMCALLEGEQRLLNTGAVGLIGGLAILAHPYYVLFPFFLAAAFWIAGRISRGSALLVLLTTVLTVTPWVVRNMLVFHTLRPMLTTSMGVALAQGWNSRFLELYANTADARLDEGADNRKGVDVRRMNALEKSDFYAGLAVRFVRTHWTLVPALVARKLRGAIDPFPETARSGILERGRTFFHVAAALPLLVVLLSNVAWRLRLMTLALVSAYLVMGIVTYPSIRYRFPLIWVETISMVAVAEGFLKRSVSRS